MILEHIELNKSRVTFGNECFEEVLRELDLAAYSACFIISQQKIWDFHGDRLAAAVKACGVEPKIRMVPDGESTKNLGVFGELLHWLADHRADRRSVVLVLGGGVVGDLSGFVAAAYMRGMDWIYVPTTLLSQQDASIGGKVAVNLPHGKNLVGHFWDPRAVIIDSSVLATLPEREVNAGYMEFLKHGMLESESLYRRVADLPVAVPDWSAHMPLLAEGLKVKVRVVREDPFEKGLRKTLNLGHTLGHAIEAYTEYKTFLHGEAVGLGLIYVTMVAKRLGGTYDWTGLEDVVRPRVPPVGCAAWDRDKMLDLTLLDKKGVSGIISWIIPFAPGKVEIVKGVDRAVLRDALDEFVEVMA
ncbi:MAG: 3-dehydroquinate synthase family protein [Acidobacteriota bacterium]|nr:3-dehydroquinate synthase family protein [Acidobacteriota bacterium]